MKRLLRAAAPDERGSAAAEFALLIPVTVVVLLAIFNLCAVLYASADLHFAVEQASRCAATSQVNTNTSCGTTQATAVTYAQGLYTGPGVGGTYGSLDDTTNNCRQINVTGAVYKISLGFVNVSIPLSAQSCFPVMSGGTAWPAT
jgi:Flp pilus assembly protein TadG